MKYLDKAQKDFIIEIKEKIRQSQYETMRTVNVQLINLYWEIGKSIADKQAESWGKSIVSTLSKELQSEFPSAVGFSVSNLFRLEVADKEYFIDLLLYHRQLQCLVAVELKVGEFQPEYKGKMEFYLSVKYSKDCA